jgi:hypothetical protein
MATRPSQKPQKSALSEEFKELLEEARRTVKITPGNGKRLEPFKPFKLEGSGPTIAEIIIWNLEVINEK